MTTLRTIRRRTNRVHPGLKFHFDYWLLLAFAGLVVVGMLTVYSTTFDLGVLVKDDATFYIKRQFWALLLGLAGAIVVMQVDYHFFRRFSVPALIVVLVSLLAILFFAEAIFGAQRGISEGSYKMIRRCF